MCGVCREDREDFDLKAAEGNTGNQKRGRPEGSAGGGGGSGGRRVFVNNLTEETTWQSLKEYFKQAGAVAHADVLAVRALLPVHSFYQRDRSANMRLLCQQGVSAGWN